jgi:Cu/Zn superoxide dismutase
MLIAIADFCKPGSEYIRGRIIFSQNNNKYVRVDIKLVGVPIGIHGIHVHQKPLRQKDLNRLINTNANCCDILGPHFNGSVPLWSPKTLGGTPHGSYMFNTERHIGDLCNNILSEDGTVDFSYDDKLISLVPKHPNCITGRSIVIHEDGDDEGMFFSSFFEEPDLKFYTESKITGNAGKRIACANILRL